jgi:4-amino-4-deoxy-L-arabinose transferase-like glycosyltransferase
MEGADASRFHIPPPRPGGDGAPPSKANGLALLWAVAALTAVVMTALYFYGGSAFPLTEPDEARYAELAREMLVRDDWVTPTLNFVKYFEKPPLVYWASAAGFATMGMTELAARLPAIGCGLITIALTVWLAARMYGAATALLVLPIIASGPLFGFMAQSLLLDVPLTCFMTMAALGVWFGFTRAAAWYRLIYVAAALATLVKGPVGAGLIAVAAIAFLVAHGGWRALRPALDWRGLALAAVITLPWFIAVSWRNPEFVHFFVVEQHLARYLWTNEHGEPIWFFLPVIPLALGPWGLLLVLDPSLLRDALVPRTWSVATRFLLIWAGVIVLFFSLSTSKLLTYVLPAMPAIAILSARALELGLQRGRTVGLARVGWLLMIAGPILSLCGIVLPMVGSHFRLPLLTPYFLAGGPVLLATGWCVRAALRRWGPHAAVAAMTIGWLAAFAVAVAGRGVANDYRSIGMAARAAMRPGDRLALYGNFVQSIGFYSGQRPIMIGYRGELEFGSRFGNQDGWFLDGLDDLRREWAAAGRFFVVINRKDLELIDPPLDPPPIVIATKDKKMLVANR